MSVEYFPPLLLLAPRGLIDEVLELQRLDEVGVPDHAAVLANMRIIRVSGVKSGAHLVRNSGGVSETSSLSGPARGRQSPLGPFPYARQIQP